VQAKHAIAEQQDISASLIAVRDMVQALPASGKVNATPAVGHELFKIGTLTDKVPQFHLLAAGNPRPETTRVSPLYQITVAADLRETVATTGD
jgi:hypothetical protein